MKVSNDIQDLPPGVVDETYVVVAAYNESTCIQQVVERICASYRHVVVVDDGSADETANAARRGGAHVLRHVINRGQGAALQTGIDYALTRGARFLVTFDADDQHRVEDIAEMLRPICAGRCEITLGSRFLGQTVNMPMSKRWALRVAVLFTRLVNGVRLTDAHNGLRAFSRLAGERIRITEDRMAHASELIDQISRSGLPYMEVPVQIRYTPYSLAKGQSVRNGFRILLHYLIGKVGR